MKQLHTRLKVEGISLPSYPIWNNLDFSTGGGMLKDKTWQQHGITTIGQVFNVKMVSFQHLQNVFGLPETAFLTYAQIFSVINVKCKKGLFPASSGSRRSPYQEVLYLVFIPYLSNLSVSNSGLYKTRSCADHTAPRLVCLKLMNSATSVGMVVTPVAHYLIYSGNVQLFFLSGPWLYP